MHDFQRQQLALAAAIRDPSRPSELMPERPLSVYRELMFNNVSGFLENGFPVLRELLGADVFDALARRFFRDHHCQSPYFLEIGREFMDYVLQHEQTLQDQFAWLPELMHFEWAELAAEVAEGERSDEVLRQAPQADDVPVLSPFAWPLHYEYPVHTLEGSTGGGFMPRQTFLLMYRGHDDLVNVLEVSAMTARLLELMAVRPDASVRLLMKELEAEAGVTSGQWLQAGIQILAELYDRTIVSGMKA